jgi:hypothetical protein
MKPGEKRVKYIEDIEVKERNNLNMTYANVPERLIFTLYYSLLNILNGFVIMILVLALIAVQFWYIGIAAVAGIVFLWAIFPNQILVLKSYAYYLLEPLGVKVLLSLFTFVFFTLSTAVYQLNITSVGGYFESSLTQLGLYFLIFIFRNKIKKIFKKNKQFKYMMHEFKMFRRSATRTVSTAADITAATVGASINGVQGAYTGYKASQAAKAAIAAKTSGSAPNQGSQKERPELKPLSEEKAYPEIIDWRDKDKPDLNSLSEGSEQPENNQDSTQPSTSVVKKSSRERFKLVTLPVVESEPEEPKEKEEGGDVD